MLRRRAVRAYSIVFAAIGFTLSLSGAGAAATAASPFDGGILYTKHCAVCHGPVAESTVKGATPSQITKAISNVTAMRALSFLRVAQVQAIAKLTLQDASQQGASRASLQLNATQGRNMISGN